MSADIPSTPPAELRAGDTAKWRRELPDYPASASWQLKVTLVGQQGAHTVTADADGDAFVFTLLASITAAWVAGRYVRTEYVTNGTERYTIETGEILLLQDLAVATGAVDTRSHARKVLDAIEAWLESKAPTAGLVEVAGRKVQNYPLADLLALRDRYRAEVRRETAGPGHGRLLVRL
jgi:hypothetical protein